MEPTLNDGQVVWVFNWAYLFKIVKVFDVVVFQQGEKELIKRVKEVKDEEVILVGDNQNDSLDSRSFGSVKKSALVGQVIVK